MTAFTLAQQIEEVERELKMRREVYPRQVGSGKMRKSVADYHVGRMQAVLNTLTWLSANETKIKENLKAAAPSSS